jgi:glyoxylase-like metal-dependent hydrolase (beta-lactamase superfamily II)
MRARLLRLARTTVLAAALAAGRPAAAAAQDAPRFLTEPLAPGVWAVRPADSVGFGMDANTLVVAGRRGTLVVDAPMSATSARQVIAAVAALRVAPVRWLVHTHWHDDHVAGAAEWRRAVPALEVLMARAAADDQRTTGAANRASFFAAIPGTARYLRDLAERGTGLDGQPASDGERAAFRRYATLITRFAAESALVAPVTPTRTFDDSLVLDLGGRRVTALVAGPGHTRADVIVDVADAGVIATGDLVITPVPFVGTTSYPRAYGATLGRVLARPHRVLLPGHGAPLHDDAPVRAIRAMLHDLVAEVDARRLAGEPLDSVRRHLTLAPWRAHFGAGDRLREALFAQYVASSAIPKAFADGAADVAAPMTRADSATAARLAWREAGRARRAGDADAALRALRAAASFFPAQPDYVVAGARAALRQGDSAGAASLVRALAAMEAGEALLEDSTVRSGAAAHAGLGGAVAALRAALAPVPGSTTWRTTADTTLFPEGLTADGTGTLLVGGLRARTVSRVGANGLEAVFAGGDTIGAVVAIAAGHARDEVWVATAALPFAPPRPGAQLTAEVLRVVRGRIVERRTLGDGTGVPGEMTVAPDGTVLVSDGTRARLHRWRPGAAALEEVRDPLLRSPQGIAVAPSGRVAWVADWAHGLLRWDLSTDVLTPVAAPAGASFVGLDGLRWHRGKLVGVQNGVHPARVVAVTLDATGTRATAVRTLDRQPYVGDITVGAIVGRDFRFVASSQWPWFDDDGRRTDERPLPGVVVRALRLDW